MSGGSYNYLCYNFDTIQDRLEDLDSMINRLKELGLEEARKEAIELRLFISDISERVSSFGDNLSNIFHAVEWLDSGDYGPDQVDAAYKAYKEGKQR